MESKIILIRESGKARKGESEKGGLGGYEMDFEQIQDIIMGSFPDAQLKRVAFKDKCECLSEVTTDPCYLDIDITTTITPTYNLENVVESIRDWANYNLKWEGCNCCEYELSVYLHVFPTSYKADFLSPKPIVRTLKNSILYAGSKAIDKLVELFEKCPPRSLEIPLILHVGNYMGYRESFYVSSIRRIDKYEDGHISIYTNVGVLPLYSETPVTSEDVIEIVEIPYFN